MKKLLVVLFSVILIAGSLAGCVLSQHFTPATIDKNAKQYTIDAGVADANDFKGWHNVIMAAKLKDLVDVASKLTQQRLNQMKDVDTLQHAIHQKTTTQNWREGMQTEELLWGQTGIASLVMGMAGMGTLTGFLGLARKRPQDITPQEMTVALSQATGKTEAELGEKERQLIQVVKGIQKFKDDYKEGNPDRNDVLESLRNALMMAQDEDTQAAVAVAKVKS